MNGLRHVLAMDPLANWVLVHDAARPCLDKKLMDNLISTGLDCPDGAILAIPVSDTVKQADDDQRIEKTLSRNRLWRAQTPQLFPIRRLAKALANALSDQNAPTDEASAMERQGARPRLVMGSQFNIKITGPEDLSLAEVLLRHMMADGHGPKQKHAFANRSGN